MDVYFFGIFLNFAFFDFLMNKYWGEIFNSRLSPERSFKLLSRTDSNPGNSFLKRIAQDIEDAERG